MKSNIKLSEIVKKLTTTGTSRHKSKRNGLVARVNNLVAGFINPRLPGSTPLDGSMVRLAFHLSHVNQMNTRNS